MKPAPALDPAIVTIIAALARSAARRDTRPQRAEPKAQQG